MNGDDDVWGCPHGTSGKEATCHCGGIRDLGSIPGKTPWRRAWQPTPVSLPGESHGQRSLVGYSPWGCTESDMTEVTEHAARTMMFTLWVVRNIFIYVCVCVCVCVHCIKHCVYVYTHTQCFKQYLAHS